LGEEKEKEERVNISELLVQHKQRFRFKTKMGWIELKHIGKLDHQEIFINICEGDKEYEDAAEKTQSFRELSKHPGGIPPEMKDEDAKCRAICAKYNHLYYIPCFVDPPIKNLDELRSLVDGLDKEEWHALQQILSTLVSPLTSKQKNLIILGLCREYHFPLAPDLFLNNMTLQQADALIIADQQAAELLKDKLKE